MTENKPKISIIVAVDEARAIGKDNALLWNIPEDLAHFKEVTSGHPVIMGEKTSRSIGRPLPARTNIVLSRDESKVIPGCIIAHSLEEAFSLAGESDEIFVIGGGTIYKLALPYADKLYITEVEGKFDGDTFFPEYKDEFTRKISEESHDNGKYRFKFLELEKE